MLIGHHSHYGLIRIDLTAVEPAIAGPALTHGR